MYVFCNCNKVIRKKKKKKKKCFKCLFFASKDHFRIEYVSFYSYERKTQKAILNRLKRFRIALKTQGDYRKGQQRQQGIEVSYFY